MIFSSHRESWIGLAFVSLGLATCLSMLVFVAMTFRRRSGLYFWSFVGLTLTQFSYNLGLVLEYWAIDERRSWTAWIFLVPGYAFFPLFEDLVFYSRLSLLMANRRTLKYVLAASLCEVALVELPTAILSAGARYLPKSGFTPAFNIFWRLEACAYVTTDMAFCLVYIFHVRQMWGADTDAKTKSVLKYILFLAISIMFMNVAYVTAAFVSTSPVVVCVDVSSPTHSDPRL
jgi:hypothetical protein